jgi:hypothetical protein
MDGGLILEAKGDMDVAKVEDDNPGQNDPLVWQRLLID